MKWDGIPLNTSSDQQSRLHRTTVFELWLESRYFDARERPSTQSKDKNNDKTIPFGTYIYVKNDKYNRISTFCKNKNVTKILQKYQKIAKTLQKLEKI